MVVEVESLHVPNTKYQVSSILLGDAGKKGSYATSSAAYAGGEAVRAAVGTDLRKSNISLGKSRTAFESTAQREFTAKISDTGKVAYVKKSVR